MSITTVTELWRMSATELAEAATGFSTPGMRTVWQQISQLMPGPTRRFMSAFFEAAGDLDAMDVEQAFITRKSVLRSWSEFFEHHPLIIAPIATDIPRKAGTHLEEGQVAEDLRILRMAMTVNALGLPAWRFPSASPTDSPKRCR